MYLFNIAVLVSFCFTSASICAQSTGTTSAGSKTTAVTSTVAAGTSTSAAKSGSVSPTPSVSGTSSTSATKTETTAAKTTTTSDKPVVVKPESKSAASDNDNEDLSSGNATSSWVNPEHTSEDYMSFADGWFFGGDVGTAIHYGDVALYNVFPKVSDINESFGKAGSFYFGKKFTFGLSVEVQGFMGSLQGDKVSGSLYKRHFDANYMQYSGNVKYNISQLIFRDTPGRKFFNRFTFYITGGCGQMFFRSRLYKRANNGLWYLENATGYKTAGIDSAGIVRGSGVVTERTKMEKAIAIPAGTKINFKLNGGTDIVLDLTYSTILTDKLDSWIRTWSHQDRYLHVGVGLCHQIGADKSGDIPDDQRIFRPGKKKKSSDAYEKSGGKTSASSDKKALFNFNGSSGKGSKSKKDNQDLELRMKMYEMQLKLFEMQYLMGG